MTSPNDGTSAHDLFLPDGPDDGIVLAPAFISVVRINARGQHLDTSGGVLPAEEIPDVASLHARYGGGWYEVYARDARKRVISRKKIGPLPGPPRPLYAADNGFEDDPFPEQVSTQLAPPPTPPQGGIDSIAAALIQGQREFMANMMQAMSQQSLAGMERERAAARESQAQQQQFTTTIVTMLTDVLKQKNEIPAQIAQGGTQTPMELMLAGMEIANGMHAQARENAGSSGGDDIATTIELVSKGVEALEKLKSGAAMLPIPTNGEAA